MLQCLSVCCRKLQCVAVCCDSALIRSTQEKRKIMCVVAVCCSVWHCVAGCGSVLQFRSLIIRTRAKCRYDAFVLLQCDAVCCSVW